MDTTIYLPIGDGLLAMYCEDGGKEIRFNLCDGTEWEGTPGELEAVIKAGMAKVGT